MESSGEQLRCSDRSWAVEVGVASRVSLPGLGSVSAERWLEWLWEVFGEDGLRGIAEGEVSVAEAAAAGFSASELVVDEARAPPDRDWVARAGDRPVTCWFDSEAAALSAARVLGALEGCRVAAVGEFPHTAADAWREAFPAIEVPGFGRVLPAWLPGAAEASPAGTTVYVDPGLGFGTGLHPTTQLCLAAVAEWCAERRPHGRVLDFGSGSGLLGIAAAVGGATRVDAVEIDDTVHEAIRRNAVRNGVADRIVVQSVPPVAAAGHDLVVANIVAAVLLAEADLLCGSLGRDDGERPTGTLVISGLRAADLPVVIGRFSERLSAEPRRTSRDGWHCLCWPGGRQAAAARGGPRPA